MRTSPLSFRPFRIVSFARFAPLALLLACDSPNSHVADAGAAVGAPSSAARAPVPLALPPADASVFSPASDTIGVAQRVTGSVLVGGHAMDYLRDLTAGGPRLSGSDQLARAGAWAADAFHKAGLAHVAIEPVSLPATWTRRATVARVVAPEDHPLTSLALGWMPPTPPGGLRGEVVLVKDLSAAGQKALGESLRGKIALVRREDFHTLKTDRALAVAGLKERGVTGVAVLGSRDNDVLSAGTLAGLDLAGALPAIGIGKEDGAWILAKLEKGAVTLAFTSESPLGAAAPIPNVVAELRGREAPDEWVLVGAHLDSWDLATGAQDNGTGAAEVLEAARAIAAAGTPPRCSIRFALWGGEEEGLFGSRAYAAAHEGELDRLVYVLNTDHGAGAVKGWNLDGREDAVTAFKALAEPLLSGLGAAGVATEMTCDTDHCPFMLAGVPTANLDVDMTHYWDVHHTPGDTLEKVSAGSLATAAAIVAATAYAIADAPDRLAKRVGHAAVAKELKKAGLTEELATGGYWKP